MAVGHVMHELPHRPPASAIGRGIIVRMETTHSRREIGGLRRNPRDVPGALFGGELGLSLKATDRETLCVERDVRCAGHGGTPGKGGNAHGVCRP